MNTFYFELAGASHRIEAFKQAKVDKGDPLELKLEKSNTYDVHAIAVYKGQVQIGYVPRTHNRVIYDAVGEGRVTASVEAAWARGCWLKVEVMDKVAAEVKV